MIFDKIENLEKYEYLHPRFKKAFEWFRKTDLKSLEFGKVFIDGENIRAHVDPIYKTKPLYKKDYEGHRRYIDVQIVLEGEEICEQAFAGNEEEIKEEYNEEKDILKACTQKDCEMYLKSGNFAIFFPNDLHKPGVRAGSLSREVRKIVLKIKI